MASKLKDAVTGPDNAFEAVLIGCLVALAVALGLQIYVVVVKGAAFSLTDFGIGVGSLLGGTGVGYLAKKKGETDASSSSTPPVS